MPRLSLFVIACLGVALTSASASAQDFDLVIENGRVLDPESGLDAVRNVGIRGGTIVAVEAKPLKGSGTSMRKDWSSPRALSICTVTDKTPRITVMPRSTA